MVRQNQCKKIIEYIRQYGSITTYDAFIDLGCVCLPKRISELKEEGYVFKTVVETGKNRFDKPVSYNRYSLIEG